MSSSGSSPSTPPGNPPDPAGRRDDEPRGARGRVSSFSSAVSFLPLGLRTISPRGFPKPLRADTPPVTTEPGRSAAGPLAVRAARASVSPSAARPLGARDLRRDRPLSPRGGFVSPTRTNPLRPRPLHVRGSPRRSVQPPGAPDPEPPTRAPAKPVARSSRHHPSHASPVRPTSAAARQKGCHGEESHRATSERDFVPGAVGDRGAGAPDGWVEWRGAPRDLSIPARQDDLDPQVRRDCHAALRAARSDSCSWRFCSLAPVPGPLPFGWEGDGRWLGGGEGNPPLGRPATFTPQRAGTGQPDQRVETLAPSERLLRARGTARVRTPGRACPVARGGVEA